MRNLHFIASGKGFAISVDALLAMLLTIAFLGFIGMGIQEEELAVTEATISIKQTVDDVFNALDNSGLLAKKLANAELRMDLITNPSDPTNPGIYDAAKKLLSEEQSLKIVVNEYRAVDNLGPCRSEYDDYLSGSSTLDEVFDACFSTPYATMEHSESTLPLDEAVIHGRKLAIMRQPVSEKTGENRCILTSDAELKQEAKEKYIKALFAEPLGADVETEVIVVPSDEISCDEEVTVVLKARNATRGPIAIMLAVDESGSMETLDMLSQESTGSFNAGTCENEPKWVSGYAGNAIQFNGLTSYINCGNNPPMQLDGDLTILFWAKPFDVDSPSRQNPICKSYGAEFCVNMEADGELRIYHGSAGSNTSPYTSFGTEGVFQDNVWVHAAITRDVSTRTWRSYKNGAYTGVTRTWTSGYDPVTSAGYNMLIGDGYVNNFNGIIDEVRIYDRVLDDSEVNQVASGTNITNGLVAYWSMNQTTGNSLTDNSGNGNNCALWNWASAGSEAKWVSGEISNALSLNGINQYVKVDNDSALDITGPISVSAWIKVNDTEQSEYMRIVSKGICCSTGYELEYRPSDGRIAFQGNGQLDADGQTIDLGWHHIVGVIDGTGTGQIYLDGADVTTDTSANVPTSTSYDLEIGRRVDDDYYFNGSVDDVRIYNTALDQGNVDTLFAHGNVATGLVGHWAFNEAAGDIASDSSGQGNSGDLIGWAGVAGCIYNPGVNEQVTSNCPANKTFFSQFTGNKPMVATYDTTPIYDDLVSASYLDFIASTTSYLGVCRDPYAYMRLWMEYPSGYIDGTTSSAYYETDYSPELGTYKTHVWSDTLINYYIYGRQRFYSINDPMFRVEKLLSGSGTHSGIYAPPEQDCSNFWNWEKVGEFTIRPDYNTFSDAWWRPYYYGYDSNSGACKGPKFQIIGVNNEVTSHVPGKEGNAISFDGAATYGKIEEQEGYDFGFEDQTGSISMWYKTSRTSRQSLLSRWGTGAYTGWNIYTSSDDVCFDVVTQNPTQGNIPCQTTGATDGKWHNVVGVWEDNQVRLYFDGVAVAPKTIPAGFTYNPGTQPVWLGRNNYGSMVEWFSGEIDEVRVYNRALTAAEALDLNNWGTNPATHIFTEDVSSGLISHLKFNEASGNNAADSSGNGNVATINPGPVWPIGRQDLVNYCGDGDDGDYCEFRYDKSIISGPFLPTGTYEVWAWSDVPIFVRFQTNRIDRALGVLFGNTSRTDTLDGGTCNGSTCGTTTVVEVPPETNCPVGTGDKRSILLGAANTQTVESYSVSSDIEALRVSSKFDYSSAPTAICGGAAMGFQNPVDGPSDPNWYNWDPTAGSIRTNTFGVNDSTISSTYKWTSGPPIAQGDYNILGWAEDSVDYELKWYLQRLDSAKNAVRTFIDDAQWKLNDEIGLIGFSTSANTLQGLTDVIEYGDDIKTALDLLEPSGETGMADAIDAAVTELGNARSGAGKFIVLLTDGRANVCRGGDLCYNETQAGLDAVAAANAARTQGITVYVIGFADASIIGAYENTLKTIAKDKDDSIICPNPESGYNCGKYYYAADQDALAEMYSLIAFEIARTMGVADLEIPIPEGMELSEYGTRTCGVWKDSVGAIITEVDSCGVCSSGQDTCEDGELLLYFDQPISYSGDEWWAAEFKTVIPCSANSCYSDFVLFPPAGTGITDNNSEDVISWDNEDNNTVICEGGATTRCHQKIPLKYADLNVFFVDGEIDSSKQWIDVSFEIDNNGFRDIIIGNSGVDRLKIAFYQNDLSKPLDVSGAPAPTIYFGQGAGEEVLISDYNIDVDGNLNIALPTPATTGNLCAPLEEACEQPSYWKLRLSSVRLHNCYGAGGDCTGTILAAINPNKAVGECELHNLAEMYCLGEADLRFYTVDYYVWED